jgi:hypothetical protein
MTFGVTCVLSRAQVTWDRSSILPHQDATDLRTRIDNLKSLLELASIGQLQEVPRPSASWTIGQKEKCY